jgi:hypothetical protein
VVRKMSSDIREIIPGTNVSADLDYGFRVEGPLEREKIRCLGHGCEEKYNHFVAGHLVPPGYNVKIKK